MSTFNKSFNSRASSGRSQLDGQNWEYSTYPPVRRTPRGRPWMVRTGRGQSCSCRGSAFIPCQRERECVDVLPVKSLMKEGGGGREKEGGTLSAAGRQDGGRHTRAHTRTHPVRLRVQAECVKPNNVCVDPTKSPSPSTSTQI